MARDVEDLTGVAHRLATISGDKAADVARVERDLLDVRANLDRITREE